MIVFTELFMLLMTNWIFLMAAISLYSNPHWPMLSSKVSTYCSVCALTNMITISFFTFTLPTVLLIPLFCSSTDNACIWKEGSHASLCRHSSRFSDPFKIFTSNFRCVYVVGETLEIICLQIWKKSRPWSVKWYKFHWRPCLRQFLPEYHHVTIFSGNSSEKASPVVLFHGHNHTVIEGLYYGCDIRVQGCRASQ